MRLDENLAHFDRNGTGGETAACHWPEGREALQIRRVIVFGDLQQFAIPNDKEPAEQRPMPLLNLCNGALDLLGLAYVPRAHVQIGRADVQINNEPHAAAVSLLTFLSDRFLK